MILDEIASLKKVNLKDCAEFEPQKPAQPTDVVLGKLSGKMLALMIYSIQQRESFEIKKAEFLETQASAIRNKTEESIEQADRVSTELSIIALRLDYMNCLLSLAIAEKFNISPDDWSICIRKGFKVVKIPR